MKKKTLIILITVLIVLAGAIWFFFIPIEKPEETNYIENVEPPMLFGKEDYKITERDEERFVLIEKAGFSAKIPKDWKSEQVGDEESSSLIHLLSPDAEIIGVLTKGCGISIAAGTAKEQLAEIQEKMVMIKEEPKKYIETQEGYLLELIDINEYEAVKWTAPEKPSLGQALGLNIPLLNGKLISIDTRFPTGYEETCKPLWEEFLNSIEIE